MLHGHYPGPALRVRWPATVGGSAMAFCGWHRPSAPQSFRCFAPRGGGPARAFCGWPRPLAPKGCHVARRVVVAPRGCTVSRRAGGRCVGMLCTARGVVAPRHLRLRNLLPDFLLVLALFGENPGLPTCIIRKCCFRERSPPRFAFPFWAVRFFRKVTAQIHVFHYERCIFRE
jgi:hypothetical protein